MSDKTETNAQNPFFNAWGFGSSSPSDATFPFTKMAEGQLSQMTAMCGEIEKMFAQGMEQTQTALDESARLSKETLGYWAKVGAESRRATVETLKQSMNVFSKGQS